MARERQIELRGPDAERLLQMTSPRDITRMKNDQCYYVPIVDVNGGMINDPIVLKLAADRFWVSSADSDLMYYYKGLAGGFGMDVQVSEPDISPLAIQGPKADVLVERLFGQAIRETAFFRHKTIEFQGQDMVIARSGWSRQGGFEIYVDGAQHGPALWDHIMEAGEDLDIRAGCPNGIERIEAGLLSYGNDVTLENTPFEADLGKYVQLDAVPTCRAREALLHKQVPERQLRPVEISGDPLPACTEAWPLTVKGKPAGQIGSAAYSPAFKSNIGIAMVEAAYWDPGSTLVVETPAGPRDVLVLLASEGLLVTLAGMLLGVLACVALIAGAGPWVQSHYGVVLNLGEPSASQGLLLAGVLAAGVLASLIPGLRAYRMSLSDGLSPRS